MNKTQIGFLTMLMGLAMGLMLSSFIEITTSDRAVKNIALENGQLYSENNALRHENEYLNTKYFSEYNLYREIVNDSILFPDVVYAQAVIETGNFTSNLFFKNNNIFGFNNGKTKFDSWRSCVSAYKRWQDKFYKGDKKDKIQYLHFLDRIGYAEDTNYINKIKKAI